MHITVISCYPLALGSKLSNTQNPKSKENTQTNAIHLYKSRERKPMRKEIAILNSILINPNLYKENNSPMSREKRKVYENGMDEERRAWWWW